MGTEHDGKFCCGTCELADRTARGEVIFEASPELVIGRGDTQLIVTVSEVGGRTLRRFGLYRGMRWIVGRNPSCDVVIDSAMASRRIFSLEVSVSGAVVVEDVGSACGMLVNGMRVQRQQIQRNDRIHVGGGELVFMQGDVLQRFLASEQGQQSVLSMSSRAVPALPSIEPPPPPPPLAAALPIARTRQRGLWSRLFDR